MSKRPAHIILSSPAAKVPHRLTFISLYVSRAAAPIDGITPAKAWANRPMNRKPRMYRMYRSPDVPRGCEGPCKVQPFESGGDIRHIRNVMRVSEVTRGAGLNHRLGKRVYVESVYVLRSTWMDDFPMTKNQSTFVMFFTGCYRRPADQPHLCREVCYIFDYADSTSTVKNDHHDRYQVLRKWYATVTGGQYASKEQALVKKFIRVNNYVVYNQQEAGKYENHSENALMLYMACTHASNPVYATLKIRIYFYDSVTN
uniref:Capsid protein n=1 Tax=Papaya leaf curl virus TaxID=53260 RepID=C6K7B1_9GEMI|nr:coat protein [Papaya leaf curl virus]